MKYVMSDIHGNYDGYMAMKEKIELKENDKLIVLGDVIDRGPDGIKILQDIMTSKNVFFMAGNHELMMFESDMLERGIMKFDNLEDIRKNWIEDNGGYPTMKAFYDLKDSDQILIMDWLTQQINTPPLRLANTDDGRIFALCHGWPGDPNSVGNDSGKVYDYIWHNVWDRPDSRLQVPVIKGLMEEKKIRSLIIGHTPVINLTYSRNEMNEWNKCGHFRIMHTPWFIDIDCGSGHSHPLGCLACLCLDTMEEFYIK